MAKYSNFNVKAFENLKTRSESIFSTIIDNVKTIRYECNNMSDIVASDDSNLGLRWRNLYDSMDKPINNIEDTFVIVKTLLDKYIEDTIANELAAEKEMEAIDTNITSLSSQAENMLSGLMALRGIGFGATAIAIPGLHIMDTMEPIPGNGEPDPGVIAPATSVPETPADAPDATVYPEVPVDEPIAVTKYAPPSFDDPIAVTKYAPPSFDDPIAVTKYAPPSFDDPIAVTKYAPPSFDDPIAVTKYAPPSFDEPIAVTKYAPPSFDDPIAVTKYAPPSFDKKTASGSFSYYDDVK
jgi:hypothetical protein